MLDRRSFFGGLFSLGAARSLDKKEEKKTKRVFAYSCRCFHVDDAGVSTEDGVGVAVLNSFDLDTLALIMRANIEHSKEECIDVFGAYIHGVRCKVRSSAFRSEVREVATKACHDFLETHNFVCGDYFNLGDSNQYIIYCGEVEDPNG